MNEIKNIIELQKKININERALSNKLNKKFGVTFTHSDTLSILKNDSYVVNIWFMEKANNIEEAKCPKMPNTEEEIINLFRAKEKHHADMVGAIACFNKMLAGDTK